MSVLQSQVFRSCRNGHKAVLPAPPAGPAVPEPLAGALVSPAACLTIPGTGVVVGFAFARITPAIARLITGANYRNRRDHRVVFYARQMAQALWKLTPQGLTFFADGTRADGDHRLNAVIESEEAVDFLITWGWSPDIASVLDQNMPRQAVDFLRATLGLSWSNSEIGAIRYLGIGDIAHGATALIPNDVLADWSVILADSMKFAAESLRQSGKKKGIYRADVLAVIASYYYRVNRDDLSRFCVGLATGLGMNNDHEQMALLARNAILDSYGIHKSSSRREIITGLAYAIELFVKREQRKYLRSTSLTAKEVLLLPEEIRQQMPQFVPLQSRDEIETP